MIDSLIAHQPGTTDWTKHDPSESRRQAAKRGKGRKWEAAKSILDELCDPACADIRRSSLTGNYSKGASVMHHDFGERKRAGPDQAGFTPLLMVIMKPMT